MTHTGHGAPHSQNKTNTCVFLIGIILQVQLAKNITPLDAENNHNISAGFIVLFINTNNTLFVKYLSHSKWRSKC